MIKILLILSFILMISGCGNKFKPKVKHGLQKSPCACLGVIYDSREVGNV